MFITSLITRGGQKEGGAGVPDSMPENKGSTPENKPGNKGPVMQQKVAKTPFPGSKKARRKFTDGRHREAKELSSIIRALEDDLGQISPGQKILLESLRFKIAVLRGIAKWVEQQPSVVKDGHVLSVLQRYFLGYDNSVRLGVVALYGLSSKRPNKTVDLESYIAGKKSATQPESGE